jgi:hypothetical protein
MRQNLFLGGGSVIALGETSLAQAQQRVTGCEACSRTSSRPFDALLREVLQAGAMTEYFLAFPGECPRCAAPIFEKTLVDFDGKAKAALNQLQFVDARDAGQELVFIDEATLIEAQDLIVGCEYCSDEAELLFDQILDAVTGCDPATTEYVICHPAKCGFCHREVMEKTMVVPR